MTRRARVVLGAFILTPTIAAMLFAGTARAASSAVKVDISATPVIPWAAAAWGCLPPGGTLPLTLTVNLAANAILDRPVRLTLPTRFTIGSGGTVTKSDYVDYTVPVGAWPSVSTNLTPPISGTLEVVSGIAADFWALTYALGSAPRVLATDVAVNPIGAGAKTLLPQAGQTYEVDVLSGSIVIDNGNACTTSPTLDLDPHAEGGVQIDRYRLAQGPDASGAVSLNFAHVAVFDVHRTLTLSDTADGVKTIAVQYYGDRLYSQNFTDTIILDRTAPAVSVTSPVGNDVFDGASTIISGAASDPTSGVAAVTVTIRRSDGLWRGGVLLLGTYASTVTTTLAPLTTF